MAAGALTVLTFRLVPAGCVMVCAPVGLRETPPRFARESAAELLPENVSGAEKVEGPCTLNPLLWTTPLTDSGDVGLVVPIPTLPFPKIVILT